LISNEFWVLIGKQRRRTSEPFPEFLKDSVTHVFAARSRATRSTDRLPLLQLLLSFCVVERLLPPRNVLVQPGDAPSTKLVELYHARADPHLALVDLANLYESAHAMERAACLELLRVHAGVVVRMPTDWGHFRRPAVPPTAVRNVRARVPLEVLFWAVNPSNAPVEQLLHGVELPRLEIGAEAGFFPARKRTQRAISTLFGFVEDHALFWAKFAIRHTSGIRTKILQRISTEFTLRAVVDVAAHVEVEARSCRASSASSVATLVCEKTPTEGTACSAICEGVTPCLRVRTTFSTISGT
jgi:hypothetical protein